MSTPDPDTSDPKKNEAPEINLVSDDNAPASLALIYPNPCGLVFSDDLWMVYIPGVYQGIGILQDLTLSYSCDSDNLSIEVIVDEYI